MSNATKPNDPINPNHYRKGGVDHNEVLVGILTHEEYCGYLRGQATKYMFRWPDKIAGTQDLLKAKWYTDKLIEVVEKEEKKVEE